ncbi:MAG: [NiFe]-hydrogenase assembly chaperone HybE [Gammaproteobacteria bacterium]
METGSSTFRDRTGADGDLMECGVCWQIYDPRLGDPARGVAPGTPFSRLPEGWRCPHCQAEAVQFLSSPVGRRGEIRGTAWAARVESLEAAYRSIAEARMRGLPVCNPALRVEAVGFRPWGRCFFGILVTPWFMNAVLLPERDREWAGVQEGARIGWTLPSGRYTFILGRLEGFGVIQSCSLFSPMSMFDSHAIACETARFAADAMLGREPHTVRDGEPESTARRRFLKRLGG